MNDSPLDCLFLFGILELIFDKIKKFLAESYCVGADETGEFLADTISEIEGE